MTHNIGNIWIRYSKKWITYYHTTLIQIQTAQLPDIHKLMEVPVWIQLRTLLQLSHELKENLQWMIKKTCHVSCSCTSNRDSPRCIDDWIKINNHSVENVITRALMQSKQYQWIYYKATRHQSLFLCKTCEMSSKAFSNLGSLERVLNNQVHQLSWKVMHIPRKDWTRDDLSPSHCASLATQGRVKNIAE